MSGLPQPVDWSDLCDRAGMQRTVRGLVDPLLPRFSPGGARLRLGFNTAVYGDEAAELEAFARPLWGLAPLDAGGGAFHHWEPWQRGLAAGTDPDHPEFWGVPAGIDQRTVETAALGLALALAPDRLWDPLDGRARDRVAAWLRTVLTIETPDNNWNFFPVLVALGLDRVGAGYDRDPVTARLDRLESYALGGGWYSDGPIEQRDYYIPFAMHYYGLIHAALAGDRERARAERFRERAAAFAGDFQHWFDSEGGAVPFGRSLTYRFAQGAFWGALAFAGVEALGWGAVKGHLMRNLRWWARRPIRDDRGVLTVGYGYPQPTLAEQYNAPGSPYWAMKAFLPLALPAGHPFWTEPEQPAADLPDTATQPHAGAVLMRCEQGRHVVLLSSRQHGLQFRHAAAKYAKFAYSSRFGFSVPAGTRNLDQGAFDSALAISDDGDHWRTREQPADPAAGDGALYSGWTPWPDVEVETWLLARPPWHLRVHRIRAGRPVRTAEGAFAVDRGPAPHRTAQEPGRAAVDSPAGLSLIQDLDGARTGVLVQPAPGTNVFAPRTVLPTLTGEHPAGEHWLVCAVLGTAGAGDGTPWPEPPRRPAPEELPGAGSPTNYPPNEAS